MKTALFEKTLILLKLAHHVDYQVLDFGCGKGELLDLLSRSVGANSRLVGYDAMEPSIACAGASYPGAEFICDRFVHDLPFADVSFDLVVTIDTFECITNKEALRDEVHRIFNPGGHVLAMHRDWDTQIYNVPSRALARKAVWRFRTGTSVDGCGGRSNGKTTVGLVRGEREVHRLVDSFCLVETAHVAGTYGYDCAQDLSALVEAGGFDKSKSEQLFRELSESSQRGDFFHSLTSFIYHGKRA